MQSRLTFGPPRPFIPTVLDSTQSDASRALYHECFTDFEQFIRVFLSGHFWGRFSEMHQDVANLERKPVRRGALEVIAAPRGNAKTVFWVLAKVIHSIVYNYQPFTVIIGYSSQEAEGKVKDIRDELLYNEDIIRVYGHLLDKRAGTQSFVAKNGCMVLARGRGGQVRGLRHGKYRPTKIICDDVEELEACQSPIQRDKTKQWFTKDVMPAIQSGEEHKGSITFIGTVLHDDALLADLLVDPSWKRQKYKAVKAWAERQDLWTQWQQLYNNLDDDLSPETAKAFYQANEAEMLKGTEVLWPDGESYYDLMVQKLKLGDAAFSSEKQNEPFDPTKQILRPEVCQRFRVVFSDSPEWPVGEDRNGFLIYVGEKILHSNQLQIIAFHDPAMAEKDSNDYGAIVVCAQDPSGYIYVLECWLKREPPDKQIKAALRLYQKWHATILYLETVGFQKLFKPLYKLESEQQNLKPRIIGVEQHKNKEHRISTMEPYFTNGWLRLHEKLEPLLIEQLKLFPTADHDDGPDALHGCVERLKRPLSAVSITKEGNLL